MTTAGKTCVTKVGVFTTRQAADRAIADLKVAGYRDNQIGLIAKDDSGTIGSVARIRAAWALSETASRTELAELLKPLNQPGNAWRGNAREVLAYADYRAMDTKAALTKFNELALSPEGTEGLRARAKAMADFLKNGGANSYGTVPADAAAPSPPAAAPVPAPAK